MAATFDRNARFSIDTPLARAGQVVKSTARGRVVKGLLAITFGVVLLAWPAPTVVAMVLTFGAFTIAGGISSLVDAWSAPPGERSAAVVHGIVDLAAGALVWAWPGITALALLYVIAGWSVVKGVVEISAAFRHRDDDEADGTTRALVGITGLLTVTFGLIMFARPGAGALALLSLIAALAICVGVSSIVTGHQLGRARKDVAELLAP